MKLRADALIDLKSASDAPTIHAPNLRLAPAGGELFHADADLPGEEDATIPVARIEFPEPEEPVAAPAPGAPPRRKARARAVFAGLAVATVATLGGVHLYGRGSESTDNAQVEGHIINISARVGGQAARVLVRDNQEVKAGEVLVELDRSDLETKLQAAQADLASAQGGLRSAQAQLALTERTVAAGLQQARGGISQAAASMRSARAGILQAEADVKAARSRRSLAEIELTRVTRLFNEQAVPQAEMDVKKALFDQAAAALDQAQARLQSAGSMTLNSQGLLSSAQGRMSAAQTGPQQIEAARAAVAVAQARVQQVAASLRQAELNLSYATIKAPAHGLISRRLIEPGQTLAADRPLLALTALDEVWVTANFKEDQIASIRPGQPARLHIDAFPGFDFQGHVESLAGASGARFSLIPPDNASGNFTKVVQRIPVLIKFDGTRGLTLLPGMSASVTISTKKG